MCNTAHSICPDLAAEYLLLHRENYLDEGADIRPRFRHHATRTKEADIMRLLTARDWRDRLVGVYLAFNHQTADLRRVIADMLLSVSGRPVRRAICLALALLKGDVADADA